MVISQAPTSLSDRVIGSARQVYRDLSVPVLYEHAVRRGEGKLLDGGTFAVLSGPRTGRSPKDKFVVKTRDMSEDTWWGQHNQPLDPSAYDLVLARVLRYFRDSELYVQDCVVSQDPDHQRTVRVITEQAYHSLFARTMFIPDHPIPAGQKPDITILHAPSLTVGGALDDVNSDAVVALNLSEGVILVAGVAYAGEMKKAVFTAMNYYLPLEGVLSLHSAANVDPRTGRTADEVVSATVVAPKAVDAGALATALCVESTDGSRKLAATVPGAEYLIVRKDGTRIASAGWNSLQAPGARPLAMAAPRPSVPEVWNPAYELTIGVEIPQVQGFGARRPYVAVWIEDSSSTPA